MKMPLLSNESRFPSKYNGGSAVSSVPRRLDVSMTTLFPSALGVSASPTPGARALRTLFVNNWACPASGKTVRIGCWYHPVVRPSVDPVNLRGVAKFKLSAPAVVRAKGALAEMGVCLVRSAAFTSVLE